MSTFPSWAFIVSDVPMVTEVRRVGWRWYATILEGKFVVSRPIKGYYGDNIADAWLAARRQFAGEKEGMTK